ncbi:hypothetical protein AALO_G00082860 [Alosa alosa]|uniref:Uncharacterized protein n=1 Tax=Alosa alosa TaxID=278164 RepID=A0AAV6H1K4_9TELE|nr:hypothetical protein AALO_G00082860 [Alosa alosa]
MANARLVSRPRAEKENISEPDQETSKEGCTLIESSVDQGIPQLDEGGGRSPSPLKVDGDALNESSIDHGTHQLDEGGGKTSSLFHAKGDGA